MHKEMAHRQEGTEARVPGTPVSGEGLMLFRANLPRLFHEGSDLGAKFLKLKLLDRNSGGGAYCSPETGEIGCKAVGACMCSEGKRVQVFI